MDSDDEAFSVLKFWNYCIYSNGEQMMQII